MEKDKKWKNYYDDNARYADLINGVGCNGLQLIKPEDLVDEDSEEDGKSNHNISCVLWERTLERTN